MVAAERGEIRLAGRPIAPMAHAELARQVAVVPQDSPRPFPFTVEQLVLMGRYPHGPGRFFENDEDRALARAAMAATSVLDLAGLPLEQLSGGERQRAMLARALAQQPRLLVDGGRVACVGTPATVLEQSVLEPVFRCPVAVDRNPASGRPLVRVAWPSQPGAARGR